MCTLTGPVRLQAWQQQVQQHWLGLVLLQQRMGLQVLMVVMVAREVLWTEPQGHR
jgi:hypothetical protein